MLADSRNIKGALLERTENIHIADIGADVADVLLGAFTPGQDFEIVSVEVFATTASVGATFDVKIGSTSVLSAAIHPDDAATTPAVLGSSVTGDSDDVVNVHATTGAGESITNPSVRVVWRPRPVRG